MTKKDEIELKVCKNCDAPLPCDSAGLNYFNLDNFICDDCLKHESAHES